MLNAHFFTDISEHRAQNEDAGGIFYNQTDQQLLVLCDGMGGHQGGDVASQFVTDMLQRRFEDENLIEPQQAETWLRKQLQDINRLLYRKAEQDVALQGMGTTCVCALIFDTHIVVANIGDSRAYLVNHREIEQVTHDHSFVNHLVMIGQITEEAALTHPQRNIITKVMGTDKRVVPDVFVKRIKFYDYLLLNSDGLTDYVGVAEIQDVLNQEAPLEQLGETLLQRAIDHDAKDNVSFVLAELGGEKV